MKSVNFQGLKDAVAAINKACGTEIKIISVKKEKLADAIREAVKDKLENLPESVKEFYELNIKPIDEPPKTELGNTMEDMLKLAGILSVAVDDKAALKDVEDMLLEHFDGLSQDDWDGLSVIDGGVDAQRWDSDMGALIKKKLAEKKKPAEEKKPAEPRPNFKFGEGTNAAHILEILSTMFANSKGEGITMKDLQDACVKAKVKSANVKGRVVNVIKYASLPEGGEQVVKEGNLIVPKTPVE